ncbi:D-mannose binding lectin [Frankia torreyi]|uniref:D-mannose binding lectin n=1 Tax=Frankia torreyi TaxID=1856 RepID=A0A0D8BLM8_9ACTN|nr:MULTISPECIES: hypothetical protein [unclassified Frankia]KJE25163.1 D-mannose binding lectin [Frankia torreyi]
MKRYSSVAFLAVLFATLMVFPGVAMAAGKCGNWHPGGGKVRQTYLKSGSSGSHEYLVTVDFRFSDSDISALACTGSSALEVDVEAYGGLNKAGGYRGWDSNLPHAYLDTEAFDGNPRVLTVGTSNAADLKSNVDYFTKIHLIEVGPTKDYSEIYLNFQRGHWAKKTSPKEQASCVSHGGSDPAWCVFGDESHAMKSELGTAPRIALNVDYETDDAGYWGNYRTTDLVHGNRLAPGDKIFSPNGLNYLSMQADGNLVEYIPGGRAVWASGTGTPEAILLAQDDGNFVVVAPGNRAVWSTGTGRRDTVLSLQDDRNLVAYAPGHIAVWSNNIAGRP